MCNLEGGTRGSEGLKTLLQVELPPGDGIAIKTKMETFIWNFWTGAFFFDGCTDAGSLGVLPLESQA